MDFPYPRALCDIGGTHVRIAMVLSKGVLTPAFKADVSAFSGLAAAMRAAQNRLGFRAHALIVCAAGPLQGRSLRLTNAAWRIDGPALAEQLDLDQGLLLNDFEGLALSLPHLPPSATVSIVQGAPAPSASRLILGAGTGFGAAALIRAGENWLAAPSEAGHMSLGPCDAEEERIWPHFSREQGRTRIESLLSGPGLRRLYRAICAAQSLPAQSVPTHESCEAEILAWARKGQPAALETIQMFWRLTARCAGDLALAFLPQGGIVLAGGVLAHLADWLDAEEFRRIFTAKAPMEAVLATIPVSLLTSPEGFFEGLAAFVDHRRNFLIAYDQRLWRSPKAQ